jgi:photosystem II stability/assembly factor-like uncharacterized protein
MKSAILFAVLALCLFAPAARPQGSPLKGRFEPVLAETDVSLHRVTMLPSGRLYACGADGIFLSSADGKEWVDMQIAEDVSLRAMSFPDENRGLLAGRTKTANVLYATRDGGRTFEKLTTDLPEYISDFAFRDSRTGWVVGGSERKKDGFWRFTTDGGRTWNERDSVAFRIPARKLNAIAGFGEQLLVAVGGHVEIALVGESARSLLYQKRKGCVLRSEDAGQSWDVQDAGNPEGTQLMDVEFVDAKNGWVVGDGGFVARTTDGGETWKKLDPGTTRRLLAVEALTATTAFLAGEQGTILSTNDGGERFTTLATGTERDIRDIAAKDERTCFAVGQGGTILRFVREW